MDLGKLTGNILTAVFLFLFLAAILIILGPFVGWHMESVLSGSMEPAIQVGSIVILGPVSAEDINVGDIIAYFDGNVEICHRIFAIETGHPVRFVTKGDANRSPDGTLVTPEKVIGKCVAIIPLAGYFVHFMKTPLGLFLAILLPLLVLIGTELKTLYSEKK